ncbi:MAG: deoxyribodipyrimidine photo-lyase [Spirochaetota bacterium]
MIHPSRIHLLNDKHIRNGPVIYWMSRDQRARDNWALLHAAFSAAEMGTPLVVVFCLLPSFMDACLRQYDFMLRGLREVEQTLTGQNIAFKMIAGDPVKNISELIRVLNAGLLVTDFDPLRVKRHWHYAVANMAEVRCVEVDAHNIIPCRHVSQKQEYAAYTIRPKIEKLSHEFLHEFPEIEVSGKDVNATPNDWDALRKSLRVDDTVKEVTWIHPGEKAAAAMLDDFIETRLPRYHLDRNDPNLDGVSMMSPYLHFGQISPQRIALAVRESASPQEAKNAYLEELIVRRELSDNFCLYNDNYDRVEGFPDWAKKTLNEHRHDTRKYIYSLEELEGGQSHEPLWNAAQLQMVHTGRMHGYMRMYWAKKILEWTETPEKAMEFAIHLNDRYQLDGRDPNGYTGIAWSMGGVHDRAWKERPIFGKIRYMNENGSRRKFDVDKYINRYSG